MRLFALTFLLLSSLGCSLPGGGFKDVSPQQVKEMLAKPEVVLVDVRTSAEIQQGYIDGAKVFADFSGGAFEQLLPTLDKSKTYVLYCRSGGRSSSAASLMAKNGFKEVYNMTGGITAWDGPLKR